MIIKQYVLEEQADAQVELVDGMWFLHCTVWDNTPSVYKWVRKCFDEVEKEAREDGQVALFAVTPSPKFCDVIYAVDDVDMVSDDYYLITWWL